MEYITVDGIEVPALGFGTARMNGYDEQYRAVSTALEIGYRHLDTAQMYGSEEAVGSAIADTDLDREELFVTTKLAPGNRDTEAVHDSTAASLERLGMEYVDLLLIHSPNDGIDHEETIRAMNDLQEEGSVRHIGVSNFSVQQTAEAMKYSETPIVTNQVKYHPYKSQADLLAFCIDENVMLTAYSPLAVGDVSDDETLTAIGQRYNKSAAQVALRWLVQQPMVSAIPMSSSAEHIRENFDVFDFELNDEDVRAIFDLQDGLPDDLADRLDI
ncbi:aldo/keto reductase [Halalkalicoccus jeotgali]|uniref:Aldo/keto reductase n=1 Tax=Halalkalicoccus jeotgali (strain DSM 18796 / CECT 7217 / JCM 14584 / KCTC 4019 / B3) TaxID=795797 RepID=D8JBE6_HALJB|nr:aldo/keto reductase [Halalkalicoccus jeotgali]ADJ16599.1 aldo/keto reductase [Halalkalicoccus jeotgali B3]ELY41304.1 aldo/keto reductase [Halalkalicoccus jeotgali B3]